MEQACPHCKQVFTITVDDLAFYENISPTISGQKFPLPPPTLYCEACYLAKVY